MGPNPNGKARIVARIRRESKKEPKILDGVSVSKQPWIFVTRPHENPNPNSFSRVKISFRSDQITSGKQSYEVDECYEQGVSNEEIFSREIKPLIPGLFDCQNCTVFAYGPRRSGKTYTIQGSEEEHGLVMLSVDSILSRAEEERKVITISVFEVCQDRANDLLDSKRQEVSVFEHGQGKIRIKGLSKVKVNSTSEFQKLYFRSLNAHKPLQKMIAPPHRSHIGCIVHVVSPQTENSDAQLVGKMNFIDLASYEDSRRKSSDGSTLAETTRINKSLYAVHNVLYALNANEARVPHRESKLTRMLQDSLGGMNKVLMISCMNPYFCPDTAQTISLASRSCQAGFLAWLDPGKSRSATKTMGMCSPQEPKSASKFSARTSINSPKLRKPMSATASGKKQTGSRLHMSMKPTGLQTKVERRKLFDETNPLKNPEQGNICIERAAGNESTAPTEVQLSLKSEPALETLIPEENAVEVQNTITETATCQTPTTGCLLTEDKENEYVLANDKISPPLSARIRELSNNLKSLCVLTEPSLKIGQTSLMLCNQINESLEPKTPCLQPSLRADDKHEIGNIASPWGNFHIRGSGIKDSLVHEYLKFLNSANKEELKEMKGIGEKRAAYILEMREESPEPFKKIDDLKDIGLSEKQIKGMLKKVAGDLFI